MRQILISHEFAFLSGTKELVLVELLPVLFYVIVGRTDVLTLVFFLLSLHRQLVLVGLEVYLVEERTDAFRFERRRWALNLLYGRLLLVLAWTYVADAPNL